MIKIFKSLTIIIAVAAIASGASYSFFSDKETSTGNTFTAGAIDLKIDNTSYVTDELGELKESPGNTWAYDNLKDENHYFFNFSDLKPSDIGEDTISLHVSSHDSWACMNVDITATPENDRIDPEEEDGDTTPGENEGELQSEVNFAFWADDGDNVYEAGEVTSDDQPGIFLQGSAAEIFDGKSIALADSTTDVWPGGNARPMAKGVDYYIAKAWCFGILTPHPVTDDSGTPLERGTGFDCAGGAVSNISQTDGIEADVTFYAEQSINNPHFVCYQPVCSEGVAYAFEVVSHDQGTQANEDNDPITDPNRIDPDEALDAPDWVVGTGINFYSLGKNTNGNEGWVVLKLADVAGFGAGADLSIYEATNSRSAYAEQTTKAEVSLDGTTWFEVGTASSEPTGDGVTHFDITGLPITTFQYIRLTDTTDYAVVLPPGMLLDTDGFDLDAVQAVYGACE